MGKTSCIIAVLCSLSLASITLSAYAGVNKIRLTAEERRYLSSRAPIKLCIDPNWMPYEAWDPKEGYIGIAADYIALFSQMLDVEFKVRETETWQQSLDVLVVVAAMYYHF